MIGTNHRQHRHQPAHPSTHGFTLIELMVTVVIVGILAAIAYPSYRDYVVRSNRSATQAFMLEIANREKQYLLDSRQYVTVADNNAFPGALNLSVPAEVSRFYTLSVTASAGPPPSFIVNATAIGSQASDGNLSLADTGTKSPSNKW